MKTHGGHQGGEHPLFTGILRAHERAVSRPPPPRNPLPSNACRCKRFGYPHPYEPTCAIVAAIASES